MGFHILNRLMFHFRTSFLPVLTSLIKNVSDIVSGYSLNRMSICDLIWMIAATISNCNHVQLVAYLPQHQCVYMNRNSSINTISFACPNCYPMVAPSSTPEAFQIVRISQIQTGQFLEVILTAILRSSIQALGWTVPANSRLNMVLIYVCKFASTLSAFIRF